MFFKTNTINNLLDAILHFSGKITIKANDKVGL